MISERLIDVHKDYSGSTVESIGQFRSYNRHEGIKNRLMLSIFVRKSILSRNSRITPRPIRYSWTAISASRLYTERLLLDGKSQIFFWL